MHQSPSQTGVPSDVREKKKAMQIDFGFVQDIIIMV